MDNNSLVKVEIKRLVPAITGYAIFIGNDRKAFVIYVDLDVGTAIAMLKEGVKKARPLTHDLIGSIFMGLGISVERVIINDLKDNIFYARLRLQESNELGKKIVEIDARPSDCIAIAIQQRSDIYVAPHVLDQVKDVSSMLKDEKQDDNFGLFSSDNPPL